MPGGLQYAPRLPVRKPPGQRRCLRKCGNSLIIRMADKKRYRTPRPTPPPNGSNGNPAVDFSGRYLEIKNFRYLCTHNGGLAQLARALAWHARGHQFDPGILHNPGKDGYKSILIFYRNPSPRIHRRPLYPPTATGRRQGEAPHRCRQTRRRALPATKKTAIGRKKTQSPVIQDNDRQQTRLLKKYPPCTDIIGNIDFDNSDILRLFA